jgi:hypothetical protein
MQETSQQSGGKQFLGVLFALVALGAILYCLGEVADNYQSARYDYLFGSNRYDSYGYNSYSNSSSYYRYKEEMETYSMIAGAAAFLGVITGLRRRREGGMAVAGLVGSLIAAGLTAYTVIEYNLL